MKKSEDIFKLIKSLTKSEKRYFKINSSLHKIGEKNVYVKLFDVIDKMDEYDEELIIEKFKGQKFVTSLFSTKKYLFDMILKSLTAFHGDSSPRFEISRLTNEAAILFDKGLYEPYIRVVKKAKSIAIEYEMFETLLDILSLEMRLVYRVSYSSGIKEKHDEMSVEQAGYIEKINNFNEINHNYNWLLAIWRKDTPPDKEDKDWILKNITNNPVYNDEKNALSNRAALFYLRTVYIISEMEFKAEQSYELLKKIVKLMDSNMPLLRVQFAIYIYTLNNAVLAEIYFKKFADAEKSIAKLRDFPSRVPSAGSDNRVESLVFQCTYTSMLVIYMQSGRYKKGISYIDEILAGLKKYKKLIGSYEVMLFYYFFAYLYFMGNDYNSALYWLNRIINDTNSEIAPEIVSFVNILKIIIHYEKKDYELVESLLISNKRALLKKENTFKFEKLAMNFFSKALVIKEEKQMNSLLDEFKHSLNLLLPDVYEKNALENLDLISWIESKQERKPFAEILKEKSAQPLK